MTLHKTITSALIMLTILSSLTTATADDLTITSDLNVLSNMTVQGQISGDGSGLTGIVVNIEQGIVNKSSNNVYDSGTIQAFDETEATIFIVRGGGNPADTPVSLVKTVTIADGNNFEMVANNSHLYVFDGNGSSSRLMVFNINDPESPILTNTVVTDVMIPAKCCIDGNYLYTVDYTTDSGLYIYNIINPENPVLVANTTNGLTGVKRATSVEVQGDYAYVVTYATGSSGVLAVYNISVPSNPVFVGSAGLNGPAWSLSVQGSYAYVGITRYPESDALVTFDISSPSNPFETSRTSVEGPMSIELDNSYAYVIDYYDDRLHIFDLVDPSTPVRTNYVSCRPDPFRMHIVGNKAFVVGGYGSGWKMNVFDLSTPTAPENIYEKSDGMYDLSCLTSSGRYVYVANNDSTVILVFETQGESAQLTADIAEIHTLNVSKDAVFNGYVTIQGRLSAEITPAGDFQMGIYTNSF